MSTTKLTVSVFFLACFAIITSAQTNLEIYDWPSILPPGLKTWPDVTVEVRSSGSDWQSLKVFEHVGMLGKPGWPIGGTDGFAAFGANASVDVRVTYKSNLSNVKIIPSSAGIAASWLGKVATFSISVNSNVVINFNDDANHPLQLFCNPLATDAPAADDNNTDYYAAGTVTEYRNTNRRDLYLAPGAIVTSTGTNTIKTKQDNARLYGYGLIFKNDANQMMQTYNFSGIRAEGPIFMNAFQPIIDGGGGGQWTWWIHLSSNVAIKNVKFFNSYYTEDAIDIDRTHDVTITNCYFHLYDDAIAIKAQYSDPGSASWQHPGDRPSYNVTAKHCIFWQGYYGSPLHIGYESYSTNVNDTFYNIKLQNSNVVRMMSGQDLLYVDSKQGSNFGRVGVVDDILVENIKIENCDSITLATCRIDSISPRTSIGSIRNVTLKHIDIVGGRIKPFVFLGFGTTFLVSQLTIDGITKNGVCQSSLDLTIQKNEFTNNIRVLDCANTKIKSSMKVTRLHPKVFQSSGSQLLIFRNASEIYSVGGSRQKNIWAAPRALRE